MSRAYHINPACEAGAHAGIEIGGGCCDPNCACVCHGNTEDAPNELRLSSADSVTWLSPRSTCRQLQDVLDRIRPVAQRLADGLGRDVTVLTAGGRGLLVKVIHPTPPAWSVSR